MSFCPSTLPISQSGQMRYLWKIPSTQHYNLFKFHLLSKTKIIWTTIMFWTTLLIQIRLDTKRYLCTLGLRVT
jgi:hypothetical protein